MRVIAIGYNVAGTGLTRAMHSIMGRLAAFHEIHFLGIGYRGELVRDGGLTLYPTNPNGGDVFAAFQAKRLIGEIYPDLVFIMHDIWMFDYYTRVLGPYLDRVAIAAYIPLDGRITNEQDAAPLTRIDRVVGYSEFSRREFEGAFRRLGDDQAPPVEAIPHGIDRGSFFPLGDRAQAKRRVFGSDDGFVILNASRPDKRKRVDLTIKGFARFAADKPANVRLCLHHAFMDEAAERELASLIRQCGIGDRVSLNPLGGRVVSDAELNLLYNACDVGINSSMGEGWGLVSCEHGAAGAPQIVPDHTACAELWRDSAELVPPTRRYVPEWSVLEMGEVSPEGVARAMEALYRSPARREELARAAVAVAHNPAHSWDAITRQFDDLIVSVSAAPRAEQRPASGTIRSACTLASVRDLATLTAADFEPLQGDRFRIAAGDGIAFDAELVAVTEIPREPRGRTPFSLVFQGGPNPPLSQGICRVEHDGLDAMEIFLVPIAPDRYEAVFT